MTALECLLVECLAALCPRAGCRAWPRRNVGLQSHCSTWPAAALTEAPAFVVLPRVSVKIGSAALAWRCWLPSVLGWVVCRVAGWALGSHALPVHRVSVFCLAEPQKVHFYLHALRCVDHQSGERGFFFFYLNVVILLDLSEFIRVDASF